MAGIFDRVSTIIKSNVNDLLEKFEDPEKMINQTIIDATNEYSKAKEQALNTLAAEKTAKKKLDEELNEADKWHTIASRALTAGNEADARAALENEQAARSKAEAQKASYEATKEAADTCRAKMDEMEQQINQMKDKADEIKAVSAAAKATNAANTVKEMQIDNSAFEKFSRMEEKAHKELAKAQAREELAVDRTSEAKQELEDKYGSGSTSIDDALYNLKKELGMDEGD